MQKSDVQHALLQTLLKSRSRALDELDTRMWVVFAKRYERGNDDLIGGYLGHSDSECLSQPGLRVPRRPRRFFCCRDDSLRAFNELLAGRGHSDAPSVTIKQTHAKLFFDASQTRGQGRLRHVQPAGGTTKMRFFCNGNDAFIVTERKHL